MPVRIFNNSRHRRINRYYDPTTDQFLSIDPDVSQTDQPYVFTNDDPLNAEDPLGLWGWNPLSDLVEAGEDAGGFIVSEVTDTVDFVRHNGIAVVALTLDGVSMAVEVTGALTDNEILAAAGTALGAAGTALGTIGCAKGESLACVSAALGAGATAAGLAEMNVESGGATQALAKGLGINLSAAAATVDVATVVVKVTTKLKPKTKK